MREARGLVRCSDLSGGVPTVASDRKHRSIERLSVKPKVVVKNGFSHGAGVLGNPLARGVSLSNDDLKSVEACVLKGPCSKEPNGFCGDALAYRGSSDPVAEIRCALAWIDVVETAASYEAAAGTFDYELVLRSNPASCDLTANPLGCFNESEVPVAPWEPGVDLSH